MYLDVLFVLYNIIYLNMDFKTTINEESLSFFCQKKVKDAQNVWYNFNTD
jgi:hypothetical protein